MSSPLRPAAAPAVPDGLAYHRIRVRRLGVPVGLVVPATIGAAATLLLNGSTTVWRGIPGFVLAVMAAPTMPLFGIPAVGGATRYTVAVATSALLWAAIAVLATVRGTSRVASGWREWRREWLSMAAGVWVGAVASLAIASVAIKINWV